MGVWDLGVLKDLEVRTIQRGLEPLVLDNAVKTLRSATLWPEPGFDYVDYGLVPGDLGLPPRADTAEGG